jgi:hypothetical protein
MVFYIRRFGGQGNFQLFLVIRVRWEVGDSLPHVVSEILIRRETGLAYFRQIDMKTYRRSLRPKGAAHTSPRQRLGSPSCDTHAF